MEPASTDIIEQQDIRISYMIYNQIFIDYKNKCLEPSCVATKPFIVPKNKVSTVIILLM